MRVPIGPAAAGRRKPDALIGRFVEGLALSGTGILTLSAIENPENHVSDEQSTPLFRTPFEDVMS
jgi:hypothetical protein